MVSLSILSAHGQRAASSVREAHEQRVLRTITAHSVTAAVWRRRLPERVQYWLAAQRPALLLELGLIARPKILFEELCQAADAFGIACTAERQLFLADVCELAIKFGGIANAPSVDVRLQLVSEGELRSVCMGPPVLRLLTLYTVAAVRHLRQEKRQQLPMWELSSCGSVVPLDCGAVLVVKPRPDSRRGKHDGVRPTALASGLFYVLRISA